MEKALDILKEIKNQKPFIYRLTSVWCRALIVNEPSKLDEAIAELEEAQLTRREWYQKGYAEAMKPKTCEDCKGFVRNDYCHIIDDDCRVVMERCNGCNQFEPKDNA